MTKPVDNDKNDDRQPGKPEAASNDAPPPRGRGPKLVVNNRWSGGEVQTTGTPAPNYLNARTALLRLKCLYSHDLFCCRFMVERNDVKTPLDDNIFTDLYDQLVTTFHFYPKVDVTRQALKALCRQHQFHPVREYFAALRPDGGKRVDGWLTPAFGVDDNAYTRAVGRLWLLAAVRRIMQPGHKFDTAPAFQGAQGVGKSKALRILAVKNEWFADTSILALSTRDQMELMEGKLLYELSDLDDMRRAETNKLKAFMSRQFDKGRPAYGHFAEDRGRQCVFAVTTNEPRFLKDHTGNRRFWPLETEGTVNLGWLREWRDQLWAEAVVMEKALPMTEEEAALELPRELWPVAATEQEKRMIKDSWFGTLQDVVMPDEGKGARYHSADLFSYVLRVNPAKEYEPGQRLKRNMIKLGFQHSTELRINKIKRNGYYWPADENDKPSAEPRPGTKLLADTRGAGLGGDDTPF